MNLDDKRLNCECGQKLPEYLGSFSYPRFCPRCGKMLSEDATKYMGYLTTDEEIKSIVLE
jgi:predicted amidophosphoribosyltransferase